ncbi:Crp/Fnr family transcriptional regulator [Aureimonas sp. AU12]|uniref:Crp/Fnr family transcriptional regulator n=1 Tax=Aureimonas sp. AU12 TaxID=1638161 RepID=UPI000783FD8B|nr:Crp/Fnr family transcriptional regulator [Aureimonas sp. AU12]
MVHDSFFIRKLEHFVTFSPEERQLFARHTRRTVQLPPKHEISSEGDNPQDVHLILSGFACRYKILEDGSRQIVAYLVPGDFCDLHVFILKEMDHAIATLTDCHVAKLSSSDIAELCEKPAIAKALWWSTLVDQSVLREWLVNVGRRSAEERIAHLLCELLVRLQSVGLVDHDNRFLLPVTQTELADTMGLTVVSVNKMIRNLRSEGMISAEGKNLVVRDVGRLKEFCGFNETYLHLREKAPASQGNRVARDEARDLSSA